MKTKLAIWFTQKKFALDVPQALEFIESIRKDQCPPELIDILRRDIDIRLAIGDPLTEKKVLSFLQEKLRTAEKLIPYWEEHPKDTNAIFFLKGYRQYMEESQ